MNISIQNLPVLNSQAQLQNWASRLLGLQKYTERDLLDYGSLLDIINDKFSDAEIAEKISERASLEAQLTADEYHKLIEISDSIISDVSRAVSTNGENFKFISSSISEDGVRSFFIGDDEAGGSLFLRISMYADAYSLMLDPQYIFESINGSVLTTNLFEEVMSAKSAACSEAALLADAVRGILGGSITKPGDFVTFLSDSLDSLSPAVKEQYYSLRDSMVAGGSFSFVNTVCNWINGKMSQGARAFVNNGSIGYAPDTSTAHWEITTLNWALLGKGISNVTSMLGQILLFAGGAITKVVGGVLTLIAEGSKLYFDKVDSQAEPVVYEDGFLPCWYDNICKGFISRSRLKESPVYSSLYLDDDSVYPRFVDLGLIGLIMTPVQDADNTVSGYDVRAYAKANHYWSHDAIVSIYNSISPHMSIKTQYQAPNGYIAYCDEWIDRDTYKDIVSTILNILYNTNQAREEGFENADTFSSEEKQTSYLIDHIIAEFLLFYPSSNPGTKILVGNFNGGNFSPRKEWIDGAPFVQSPFYAWYGFLMEAALESKLPSWEEMVGLHNFQYDTVSSNVNSLNFSWGMPIHDLTTVDSFYCTYESVTLTGSGTPIVTKTSALAGNGLKSLVSLWSSDPFGFESTSYVFEQGATCRYYPPRMSVSLARFIKIVSISIAVVAVASVAFYASRRSANGRRQASLYSGYSSAVEAYKANPSIQNLQTVKASVKKLNRNVKTFGSSRYLTSLSGARFGWENGDYSSNTFSNSLAGLIVDNDKNTVTNEEVLRTIIG